VHSFPQYTTGSYLSSTTSSYGGRRYAGQMDQLDVKSAFSSRLKEVCEDEGLPERGRQTALAKRFSVSQQAAKKWLSGESLPELDKVISIANWADVNVVWLLQGIGSKRVNLIDTKALVLSEAIENLPIDSKQQVLDFISYKIERADGLFTGERLSRYMTMIDAYKHNSRKEP
jgi:transcriptional regulator with XRE-family HTH domain